MKHLLSNTTNYRVYVEITDIDYPVGSKNVAILTQYIDSKNPDELQQKFNMILTKEEVRNLGLFLVESSSTV